MINLIWAAMILVGIITALLTGHMEEYANLTENVEMKLDEADRQAKATDKRLSHEEVFSKARSVMDAR